MSLGFNAEASLERKRVEVCVLHCKFDEEIVDDGKENHQPKI